MTDPQGAPDKARFLIHAVDNAPLSDFLAMAASDPEIAVVDTVGPPHQPHTAVVEISPDKARVLAQFFRSTGTPTHQLIIEPDRPLSMFAADPGLPI